MEGLRKWSIFFTITFGILILKALSGLQLEWYKLELSDEMLFVGMAVGVAYGGINLWQWIRNGKGASNGTVTDAKVS